MLTWSNQSKTTFQIILEQFLKIKKFETKGNSMLDRFSTSMVVSLQIPTSRKHLQSTKLSTTLDIRVTTCV